MVDLVSFVNAEWVDPVTQAAVAHAQFETIHPYGDGNGRILIGWILAHRTGITVPPPVSIFIARDPGGYLAGLTRFRFGELDPWVEWLAAELQYSSEAAEGLVVRSEQLLEQWQLRTDDLRADATARQVLPVLVEHPVVSSDLVAQNFSVSERAARAALATLAERDILQPFDTARRPDEGAPVSIGWHPSSSTSSPTGGHFDQTVEVLWTWCVLWIGSP